MGGLIYEEVKYPIVNGDPDFSAVVGAFRQSDWIFTTAATVGTMPFGYYAGRPQYLHRPTMWMGAIMGACFGIAFSYQNSAARLLGYRENAEEVAAAAKRA